MIRTKGKHKSANKVLLNGADNIFEIYAITNFGMFRKHKKRCFYVHHESKDWYTDYFFNRFF